LSLPLKLSSLAMILIADLLFFLFFSVYYPETLETVLQWLPWESNIEKALLIISGLIIAVLTSTAIIYVLVKNVLRGLK